MVAKKKARKRLSWGLSWVRMEPKRFLSHLFKRQKMPLRPRELMPDREITKRVKVSLMLRWSNQRPFSNQVLKSRSLIQSLRAAVELAHLWIWRSRIMNLRRRLRLRNLQKGTIIIMTKMLQRWSSSQHLHFKRLIELKFPRVWRYQIKCRTLIQSHSSW